MALQWRRSMIASNQTSEEAPLKQLPSPSDLKILTLQKRVFMAPPYVKEDLHPHLDSTSEPPPLFDGTTRLYTYLPCPFAQRVWISRNCKGLQDKIKLVPIDLKNRPSWYKEKVYPENKVPSLEHNNKIIGESLVLLKYLEDNFEGPILLPNDPSKQQFAEELLAYTDTFNKIVYSSFKGDPVKEAGSAFDYLETALHKFEDGPFFLGQFSLVDIAYAPFCRKVSNLLTRCEMNKIDAYTETKCNPKELIQNYKQWFLGQQ